MPRLLSESEGSEGGEAMSESLPCPFCGGDVRITLVGDEFGCCWWQVSRGIDNATACHCRVFMESDRKWQVNDGDEPEDYPLASAEKRWLIEKWNTRKEQTCENISDPPSGFLCSSCGWGDFSEPSHLLTSACYRGGGVGPNYCPNCGAKVKEANK